MFDQPVLEREKKVIETQCTILYTSTRERERDETQYTLSLPLTTRQRCEYIMCFEGDYYNHHTMKTLTIGPSGMLFDYVVHNKIPVKNQ